MVDVDVESGTVTLEGGEKLEADLLIGELFRHDN